MVSTRAVVMSWRAINTLSYKRIKLLLAYCRYQLVTTSRISGKDIVKNVGSWPVIVEQGAQLHF